MASQERARYTIIGVLSLTVTLLGFIAMSTAGGVGAFAFSLYGPLWVILGLAITINSFLHAFRDDKLGTSKG